MPPPVYFRFGLDRVMVIRAVLWRKRHKQFE
jgi:hypothetical protein